MNLIKSLSLFSTTVIGMGVLAAVPQIAQATEIGGTTDDSGYTLTNEGTYDSLASSFATTFTFTPGILDYTGPTGPISVIETITGDSVGPVSVVGSEYQLDFTDVTYNFTTPGPGGVDVFSATVANDVGDFTAFDGSGSAGGISSATNGLAPTDITFTSPYIPSSEITDPLAASFSLSDISGSGLVVSGGLFESFTASGNSNFSANVPLTTNTGSTPEPSPAIAIGIASVGLLGLLLFNKKRLADVA